MATCPIQPLLRHGMNRCNIVNMTSPKEKILWPRQGQNKGHITKLHPWTRNKHRLQAWINTAHRVNRSSAPQDK